MSAALIIRDGAGTARTITDLRMRDGGGTLRTLTQLWISDANAGPRLVFDPSGASAFSVSISPSSAHAITHGTGTATTGAVTASPTGGTAPYTYAWTLLSHDAGVPPTATAPAAATTAFTQTGIGPSEFYTAGWRCTVTDNLGLIATADVSSNFADAT